ncbi:hypothetical protein [Tsuneonella mangrovi]|uniref:hypothetical protein n=1 Tax=Tsuneonella mangrovi TaxID=1982042 RepID=UPI000BA2A615|nr:hypothetical protein [Tsuneonella mangrovi]
MSEPVPHGHAGPMPRQLYGRLALGWLAVCALFILASAGAIAHWRFPDPDDTLRLVQVRDLLAGQGWYDLVQHRLDAPDGGVPMHWSRLVDVPIALAILLARPFLGEGGAEGFALIFVPLVTFGVAMVLLARFAWRHLERDDIFYVCVAFAMSVPVMAQLRPLRIDHHGWQIVCALVAVNALMSRSPRIGGWVVGAALATWLSISIEGLPLAAAICGVAALRWLREDGESTWFVATIQGLGAASVILFAATRGTADVIEHCDAISPIHVGIFVAGALGATALGRLRNPPVAVRLAGLGGLAAMALAILWLVAPQCTSGAFIGLDPLVDKYWYANVTEGLPIWRQDISTAAGILVPGVISLWATLQLARLSSGSARRWWQDYGLMLLASFAIAVLVARAGAVLGALAAVPIGWQVRRWLIALRSVRNPARRSFALASIAVALVPTAPVTLVGLVVPARAFAALGSEDPALAPPKVSDCDLAQGARVLDKLPRGEILSPLDIAPELLYRTRQTVIASGHHRGAKAMHVTIATFLATPDDAHGTLVQRGTRYVAICPDLNEPQLYREGSPHGLMADILADKAPKWMNPVRVRGDGSLEIWRIES